MSNEGMNDQEALKNTKKQSLNNQKMCHKTKKKH